MPTVRVRERDIGFDPDPYPMSDIGFTTDLRGRFNIIIPEGDYEIIAGDSVENTVREPTTIVADETTRVTLVVPGMEGG